MDLESFSNKVAGIRWHPVGIPSIPLHVTADRIGQGNAQGAASEMVIQGIGQIVDFHLRGIAGTVDATA